MTQTDWLSPDEAAALLGFKSVDYFRRFVLPYIEHINTSRTKRPRYKISRAVIEAEIERQTSKMA
jgi:hypothetical protein